jgi:hypothetical protein
MINVVFIRPLAGADDRSIAPLKTFRKKKNK